MTNPTAPAAMPSDLTEERLVELTIKAMRAFEPMSSVLRYREADKWHTCDVMGMRAAVRAIWAELAPILAEKERDLNNLAEDWDKYGAELAGKVIKAEARALAAEAALAAERERCAKIAEGASADFDFAEAQAECRDYDCGYNSGRQLAAAAIRAQGE